MKGKIVCDSSVIVKWLTAQNEQRLRQANKILTDAQKGDIEIFAPELAKYEVGNTLLTGKRFPLKETRISLASFYSLPVKFVSESYTQSQETYEIGEKANITYYDACFISLAKLLNATLVTDNPKHQARVKNVKVIALENYK